MAAAPDAGGSGNPAPALDQSAACTTGTDDRAWERELRDSAGPQDACGVFGIWAPGEDVANLTYYGLYALQHRGQEAAGMAVADGRTIVVFKELGLVAQV